MKGKVFRGIAWGMGALEALVFGSGCATGHRTELVIRDAQNPPAITESQSRQIIDARNQLLQRLQSYIPAPGTLEQTIQQGKKSVANMEAISQKWIDSNVMPYSGFTGYLVRGEANLAQPGPITPFSYELDFNNPLLSVKTTGLSRFEDGIVNKPVAMENYNLRETGLNVTGALNAKNKQTDHRMGITMVTDRNLNETLVTYFFDPMSKTPYFKASGTDLRAVADISVKAPMMAAAGTGAYGLARHWSGSKTLDLMTQTAIMGGAFALLDYGIAKIVDHFHTTTLDYHQDAMPILLNQADDMKLAVGAGLRNIYFNDEPNFLQLTYHTPEFDGTLFVPYATPSDSNLYPKYIGVTEDGRIEVQFSNKAPNYAAGLAIGVAKAAAFGYLVGAIEGPEKEEKVEEEQPGGGGGEPEPPPEEPEPDPPPQPEPEPGPQPPPEPGPTPPPDPDPTPPPEPSPDPTPDPTPEPGPDPPPGGDPPGGGGGAPQSYNTIQPVEYKLAQASPALLMGQKTGPYQKGTDLLSMVSGNKLSRDQLLGNKLSYNPREVYHQKDNNLSKLLAYNNMAKQKSKNLMGYERGKMQHRRA
ncbi:hypothetical protein K9M79_01290 [Candidatus Woesearchaeota archaeon]|nr:hypothetical protein [Candidatus Woesearchaeota archaeon]